ncbi:hypothetical protein T492DRAFT_873871 [Pavlovales sp. CCMP2436]|nr:hypothetical protein T492DRAFT_873871 [Pavlovales sp. CCMP2436]
MARARIAPSWMLSWMLSLLAALLGVAGARALACQPMHALRPILGPAAAAGSLGRAAPHSHHTAAPQPGSRTLQPGSRTRLHRPSAIFLNRPASAPRAATNLCAPAELAEVSEGTLALFELARSVGSVATRVETLEWARAGVEVWRRDLRRGVLPGSVADGQTLLAARPLVVTAGFADVTAGVSDVAGEIWPGEPLLSEFRRLASALG